MRSGDRVRIVKPYMLRGRPLSEFGEVGEEGVVVGVVVDLAEIDGVGRAGRRRFWHPFDGLEVIGRCRIPPGRWVYDETTEEIVDVDGVIGRHQPATGKLAAAAPLLADLLLELIAIEGPQPGTAEWADKVRAAIATAGLDP